jgi:outer membrane protein assembly factor BamA
MTPSVSIFLSTALLAQNSGEKPQLLIEKISAQGSRIPESSVLKLFEVKAGHRASELEVREACRKLTLTGLFKNIEYVIEGTESGAALALKIRDEQDLLPARIDVRGVEEAQAWQWLREVDPLFTDRMPYTEAAVVYYAKNIEQVLQKKGYDIRIVPSLAATKEGLPERVEFKGAMERSAPRRKRK